MVLPSNPGFPNDAYSSQKKRRKVPCDNGSVPNGSEKCKTVDKKKPMVSSNVIDYSDPFAISNMLEAFNTGGKYGSVSKEIEALILRNTEMLNLFVVMYPTLSSMFPDVKIDLENVDPESAEKAENNNSAKAKTSTIVILDSDDEEENPQSTFQEVSVWKSPASAGQFLVRDEGFREYMESKMKEEIVTLPNSFDIKSRSKSVATKPLSDAADVQKDKGVYLGVEEDFDDENESKDDGLGDIWKEMTMALECSKDAFEDPLADENKGDEDCEHSFILKDDIGYVCRICGVIERAIETIIEIQYIKAKKSNRTYVSEPRNGKEKDSSEAVGLKLSGDDLMVTDISAHPRHMKVMKPHQVEGFNFLCSNLVTENPAGCILAHAPGSGKTFMIISFMQSFLAKYPQAKPLVVLPKGILATWKKEFEIWQVEDLPLLDFYSVKADSRAQQLEVLKHWVEMKSILFLGYKQFSTIICDTDTSPQSVTCQEILLKAPTILILDEGHTPRNENTDVLQSLARVETTRKVVLSGTLYQNHVKEVFNILNLVQPRFLKISRSKAIKNRILSKVDIAGVKKQFKAGVDSAFYDVVEHTLQKDENFERKVGVIHDLREMTSQVLHYYKGDFLDDLPGLYDFTVVLNLSSRQRKEAQILKTMNRKFKISAVGSCIYLHPKLVALAEKTAVVTDVEMDGYLDKLDVRDGVKAKFFLNMLNLCESAGEKMLVFSQYLTPLKFLERLAVKVKCWRSGREIFSITGDSSSEIREWSMDQFNNSPDARVFFGSIKACGEGISLVGASRIIILDVHLNPSVTRQAIGRAFRPGQKKKVYTYRLVAADSPESEDHSTCFKKELIAKMWFEWNEYCGYRDFEVKTIDINECDDPFLDSPILREDIKVLYKR